MTEPGRVPSPLALLSRLRKRFFGPSPVETIRDILAAYEQQEGILREIGEEQEAFNECLRQRLIDLGVDPDAVTAPARVQSCSHHPSQIKDGRCAVCAQDE